MRKRLELGQGSSSCREMRRKGNGSKGKRCITVSLPRTAIYAACCTHVSHVSLAFIVLPADRAETVRSALVLLKT